MGKYRNVNSNMDIKTIPGVLGEVSSSVFNKLTTAPQLEGATARQQKALNKGTKFLGGASLFIASTTLLDMAIKKGQRVEEEMIRKSQIKEQKKEEEEKEKRARQYRNGVSFGHGTDVGKIVFDMFDQRTGHHRMGNSHFYKEGR